MRFVKSSPIQKFYGSAVTYSRAPSNISYMWNNFGIHAFTCLSSSSSSSKSRFSRSHHSLYSPFVSKSSCFAHGQRRFMLTRVYNSAKAVSRRAFPHIESRNISTGLLAYVNKETKQRFYKHRAPIDDNNKVLSAAWVEKDHYCCVSQTDENHVTMATHTKTTEIVDPKNPDKFIKILNPISSTIDLEGFQGDAKNKPTEQRMVFVRRIENIFMYLRPLTDKELMRVDPKSYILLSAFANLHETDDKLYACYQWRILDIYKKTGMTHKERLYRIRRIHYEMLRDNFCELFRVYIRIDITNAIV